MSKTAGRESQVSFACNGTFCSAFFINNDSSIDISTLTLFFARKHENEKTKSDARGKQKTQRLAAMVYMLVALRHVEIRKPI